MEGINITELVQNQIKSPELEQMNIDLRKQYSPTEEKKTLGEAFDFGEGLLFGTGMQEKVEKPSLSFENTNVNDAFVNIGGDWESKYPTYKRGRDNAEYAAATQTKGEKWSNGAIKFLGKTGNAIIGGTAGVVYGVGAAIGEGSRTALYDNDFSNTLNEWDEKMNYNLANYYSKQDQDKNLFGQMGTANFWADKVLGGLSFTIGAIVSEALWAAATGGASVALGAAKWGVKGLGLAKAGAGVTKYSQMLKSPVIQAFRAGKISKEAVIRYGKFKDISNTARFMLTSAGYEASVEALQYKKEAEENFYRNFQEQNGRTPSAEEISEFNENNANAANAVFGTNLAIVGISNLVTMGTILGVKSPIKTGFNDFIDRKAFGYGLVRELDDAGKVAYKTLQATRAQKVARGVFNWTKAPITEGLYEEGFQGVTNKMANKWIEHSYNTEASNENFDTIGAMYESLGEQYGTKEGWVENGVGMIIGALGGSINTRAEMKQKAATLEYKKNVANTFSEQTLQEAFLPKKFMMMNQMSGFAQEAQQEAQKGNIVKSQLAKNSTLFSFINAKHALGEDINNTIEEVTIALDNMTSEQWKETGIENSEEYKKEALAEFKSLSKQYATNRKFWEYTIGKKIVGQNDLGTGVIDEVTGGTNTNEMLIQSLTWMSTTGENVNTYMRDILEVIGREVGVEFQTAMDAMSKMKRQSSATKGQITKTVNNKQSVLKERETLVKQIAKLNAAPKVTQGNKEQASPLAGLTNRLLELDTKIGELDTQLQGFVESINKQGSYKTGLEGLTLNQDISKNEIKVEDLENLSANIAKLKGIIDAASPQKQEYLNDLLKEYTDAEEIFLTNQATEMMMSSGEAKIEQIYSWIGGKLKKSKKMDGNTNEWLTDVLQKYQNSKLSIQKEGEITEALIIQDISDEEYNNFIDNGVVSQDIIEKISEKVKNKEELTDREKEIFTDKTSEINELLKGTVVQKTKPKSEEQILQEQIEALEVERTQELEEITTQITAEVAPQPTSGLTLVGKLKVGDKIKQGDKTYTVKYINEGIVFEGQEKAVDSIETEEGTTINNPYYLGTLNQRQDWLVEKANNTKVDYLLNTPSSQIIEELNQLKTVQEKLNWLKEKNLLEPILINGVPYDLVDYNGRNIALMKIGGVNIPFYISTGQAGKKSVKVGNWYAVFGIGTKAGWINKGTEEQINTQYGYPILQKISKILNEGVGNIENRENNGNGRLKEGIGFLEDDVQTLNSFNSQMNLTTEPARENTDIDGFNKHVSATLNSINKELLSTQQPSQAPTTIIELEQQRTEELSKVKPIIKKEKSEDVPIFETVKDAKAEEELQNKKQVLAEELASLGADTTIASATEVILPSKYTPEGNKFTLRNGKWQTTSSKGQLFDASKKEVEEIEKKLSESPNQERIEEINAELGGINTQLENIPTIEQEVEQEATFTETEVENQAEIDRINSEYNAKIAALEQQPIQQEDNTQEQIDKINKKYDKKINDLKPKVQPTKIEEYKQRIADVLKKNGLITYEGISQDDISLRKPTQEEVDEYLATKSNTKRKQELRKKLGNWKLLDSVVDSENNSIVEILTLIEQLEQEQQVEDTKEEITEEEAITSNATSDDFEGEGKKYEPKLLQNTAGAVTVKQVEGENTYKLSHVKMLHFVDVMGGAENATLNGKPTTREKLAKLKPGDTVVIDGVTLKYLAGGVIEINKEDFRSRQELLNMYVKDTKTATWSYRDIYVMHTDGSMHKMPSQIEDIIEPRAVFDVAKGDKLTLHIDNQDRWNDKDGDNVNQLKIYQKNSKGEVVGVLKGINDNAEVDENFLMIRQEAYDRWVANGKPDTLDLGIKVVVENVFLGSVELSMFNNQVTNVPFTETAISLIVAKGYIENGEFVLDKSIAEVSKLYVGKLSKNNKDKKIPVVVFKKGVHYIAYPITMVKTPQPQIDIFDSIMSSPITEQEKIQKINQAIQDYNIKTNKLVYSDFYNIDTLKATEEAFKEKQTYVDAQTLAKNDYNKSKLSQSAVINIDLENLDGIINSGKIRIAFENVEITTTRADKYENLTEIENRLHDLALEIYKDFTNNSSTKYIDKKGNILEDTVFSITLRDKEVKKTDVNMIKQENIKILETALFGEKLNKIIESVIGIGKIKEVEFLLKKYKFKKDMPIDEETINSGKKNTDC